MASEKELERELDQPRIARQHDATEVCAVRDVPVQGHELRVVHDVEFSSLGAILFT